MNKLAPHEILHLIEHGILEDLENSWVCDLTGEVHELYSRTRWPELTDQQYSDITPALRLTTQFLELDISIRYLARVALGKYEWDQKQEVGYIADIGPITRDRYRRTIEILLELAERVEWLIGERLNAGVVGAMVVDAETRTYVDHRYDDEEIPSYAFTEYNNYPYRVRVDLNESFIDYLTEKPIQQRLPGERARFFFYFSMTVLHETAHVLEKGRYEDELRTRHKGKASFYHDPRDRVPELGYGLEEAVFLGVRYTGSPYREAVPKAGIWRSTFADLYTRGPVHDREVRLQRPQQWLAVPVSHIHRYLTQQFWRDAATYGYSNLSIPPCTLTDDTLESNQKRVMTVRGSRLWDLRN